MPGDTASKPTHSDIYQKAANIIAERGEEYFQSTMMEFSRRLDLVSQRNHELAQESHDGEVGEGYEEKVRGILEATQGYYNFIGGLPDDMRGILLIMLESQGAGGETLESLGNTLGLDITDFQATIEAAPLLSVQTIRPKNYIMQVDAITNQLATLGEQQTRLRVGGKGSNPIRTTVTLDIPDHMRIEGGGMLSTYDKSILNGVTSMIESGNTVFSIPMLYHAMTGKANPTVDEALYDELAGKLEKMRRMILTIDLTEENEARYITDENGDTLKIEDLELEGYLLPLNKVSGMVNGRKAELYQIIQHPPLYTYSKMKRQLATVKIALLDAPVNNNSTTIPLKTYLLQRIELMKNKRNHIVATNILYESVYTEIGASDANKTKKMRIRGYTTTILQHFVDQGYISGYAEYKQGRSVAGVNIEL